MGDVIAIIPARGGSKGIPRKNIAPLCGKPLIAYTIAAAINSGCIDNVILSSDSKEILDCGRTCGLQSDHLRPDYLALDTTPTIDVLLWEVERYEQENQRRADTIILLQPTAPLRIASDIENALSAYKKAGQPSLISVYNAESVHPSIMYKMDNGRLSPVGCKKNVPVRRQDFEPVYIRNGAIYIVDRDYMIEHRRIMDDHPAAYVMPQSRSINIDHPEDLEMAEFLIMKMQEST